MSSSNDDKTSDTDDRDNSNDIIDESDDSSKDAWKDSTPSSMSFLCFQASNPDNPDAQFHAVMAVRKLLQKRNGLCHVPEVIRVGFLPVLVTCLEDMGRPKLQMEAACAVTNVASGTTQQTQAVVECGAISKLVDILKRDVRVGSSSSSFQEDFILKSQALGALGNIIADGPTLRDVVLSYQVVPTVVRLALVDKVPPEFLQTVSWFLSNLWKEDPPPFAVSPEEIFPVLKVFLSSEDEYTIYDSLCTLPQIAKQGIPFIDKILEADFGRQILRFLSHPSVRTQHAAVIALGSMTLGADDQVWAVAESGALHRYFPDIIAYSDPSVSTMAFWVVSNLVLGEDSPIDLVFRAGLIPLIILHLDNGVDEDLQKEAALVINNILGRREMEYTKKLVIDYAIIPVMCNVLEGPYEVAIEAMAEGLFDILETFQEEDHHSFEMVYKEIRDYGLDHCYTLRDHPQPQVQRFIEALLDFY